MGQRGLRSGLVFLLAATAAAQAAVVESSDAVTPRVRLRNPAQIDVAPQGNPLWGVPFDRLSMTRERPLFSMSRRRPTPPVVAIVPAAPSPPPAPVVSAPERPPLVLIGTIIGPSLQAGLFREENSDAIIKLAAGGNRRGWTLRSVSRNDALFEMADRTVVLPLHPSTQPILAGKAASQATGPRRREWFDN
ncbi:general secretion pathway protein GspN [Bradyrhizobium sp. WSM 1704]|uniref:general secretion pathway protein GspN n=1 Tax=Bradyrhizobium semiaridum TaxID=2821404 RepID=UPI001CE2C937|nr:general secretion pathway protein GspN [Bradyrhizobium semiaridum]MCA6122648.1 general secretion pathway protein GspN [Bradyrhizobium semiaridum]